MGDSNYPEIGNGWSGSFPRFRETPAPYIRDSLAALLRDVSLQQIHAWDESIGPLQREIGEVLTSDPDAAGYAAILEYQLPMEHRRPDVILLVGGSVLVLELKGKSEPEFADLDQASAYARDLRAYHRECADHPVAAALVLTRATGRLGESGGVAIVGLDAVDDLAGEVGSGFKGTPITRQAFLDPDAYRPLPSLVKAARELLAGGSLRRIHRADAATRPTLDYLTDVARQAAVTRTRHLVLLSGLPGTGKTLVGLQLAHAAFLDDLAVDRAGGKPTAPAVYLSGNGPLVRVLQYELRGAGGGGSTFVRAVKAYVERYSKRPDAVPPEHVLIFDEAQRAFDAEQVRATHGDGAGDGKSEPEHFVEFAERIPDWCVVVGLIGSGQEIHVGEEGGIGQWRDAIEHAGRAGEWTVHVPAGAQQSFEGLRRVEVDDRLHLTAELRYHFAEDVHRFVAGLLVDPTDPELAALATKLEAAGYHLRITRDLDDAKTYLRQRYADEPDKRYGLIASSRDNSLESFGIPNGWNATQRVKEGPWFAEGDNDDLGRSCRTLRTCLTEFGCQGLELDASLVAWGSDLFVEEGRWTNRLAKRYAKPTQIRDAHQLRLNAYRVLLTRARDAAVIFVPPLPILDRTYDALRAAGFQDLSEGPSIDDAAFDVEGPGLSLDQAIAGAADAAPGERIEFRDPIAQYGDEAIAKVLPWLQDPTLAAFAVRVIARTAEYGAPYGARHALQTGLSVLREPALGDARAALIGLGSKPRMGSARHRTDDVATAASLDGLIEGKVYRRRSLHEEGLGGNRQKGISYPADGTYVMLFSDPDSVAEWGYRDGPLGPNRYRYYGEWNGTGDMTMVGGNAAMVRCSPQIYLFSKTLNGHVFRGRHAIVATDVTPATRDGREHKAIVFTLERAPSERQPKDL